MESEDDYIDWEYEDENEDLTFENMPNKDELEEFYNWCLNDEYFESGEE